MRAYLMVGAPGSGKSTLAKRISKRQNAVTICFDSIREELYGSEAIQGKWPEIWERFEELVSESCGVPVVVDGTHFRKDFRTETIALLKSFGYNEIQAVIVNATLETCLQRNASRERNVPEYVIEKMHTELLQSLHTIDFEDFDRVIHTDSDDDFTKYN